MAWIHTISDDEAEGSAARQFAAARKRAGRVYNIVRLHSLLPDAMRASLQLYATTTTAPDAPLSRMHREMIAVVVSRANDCFY